MAAHSLDHASFFISLCHITGHSDKTNLDVLILGGPSMSQGRWMDDEEITSHTKMGLPPLTVLRRERLWKPGDTSRKSLGSHGAEQVPLGTLWLPMMGLWLD